MRKKNAFRNSFFSLISQIALIIVGFFSQRVMNMQLGEEFVGMNGVISNIIAMLSVTELGISSAIVFHLYQALADDNKEEIARLMNFYRKAYYCFSIVITVLGVIVVPIIPLFFKNSTYSISYIRLIYILWMIRTVLSYLLSYKRSILIADQKEYVVSIVTLIINVVNYSTIIAILLMSKDYAIALTLNIVVEVLLNAWIIFYVDKKYPYLKELRNLKIGKEFVRKMFDDLKNIFVSHLCLRLLISTDNLIISSCISVAVVGLYSNYCLITRSIMNVLTAVSNAIQPSVGNMFTEKNSKKNYELLRDVTFLFAMVSAFCAAAMVSLISIFVKDFWLSDDFLLSNDVVICLVAGTYFYLMNLPIAMVMAAGGLFEEEKKISVISTVANLVLSIGLVNCMGLFGVVLGTLIAYFIQFVYRVFAFFKVYLKRSMITYAKDLVQYVVTAFLECALIYFLVDIVYAGGGVVRFFAAMVICVVVSAVTNLLLFCKTNRFKNCIKFVK